MLTIISSSWRRSSAHKPTPTTSSSLKFSGASLPVKSSYRSPVSQLSSPLFARSRRWSDRDSLRAPWECCTRHPGFCTGLLSSLSRLHTPMECLPHFLPIDKTLETVTSMWLNLEPSIWFAIWLQPSFLDALTISQDPRLANLASSSLFWRQMPLRRSRCPSFLELMTPTPTVLLSSLRLSSRTLILMKPSLLPTRWSKRQVRISCCAPMPVKSADRPSCTSMRCKLVWLVSPQTFQNSAKLTMWPTLRSLSRKSNKTWHSRDCAWPRQKTLFFKSKATNSTWKARSITKRLNYSSEPPSLRKDS